MTDAELCRPSRINGTETAMRCATNRARIVLIGQMNRERRALGDRAGALVRRYAPINQIPRS